MVAKYESVNEANRIYLFTYTVLVMTMSYKPYTTSVSVHWFVKVTNNLLVFLAPVSKVVRICLQKFPPD